MRIDSLIVINSLSLATFPLFVALLYTGKAAKLKLFITIRESIHIALLRIKTHGSVSCGPRSRRATP